MKKKRYQLANEIADILEKNSYESVSVTTICDEKGFSRQNFYYYFSSIDDVVDTIVDIDIENIEEFLPGSNALKTILTVIARRPDFYKKMFATQSSTHLMVDIFAKKLVSLYGTMAAFYSASYEISYKSICEPLFKQFAMADISLILDWAKEDFKKSREDVLKKAISSEKSLFSSAIDLYLAKEKKA